VRFKALPIVLYRYSTLRNIESKITRDPFTASVPRSNNTCHKTSHVLLATRFYPCSSRKCIEFESKITHDPVTFTRPMFWRPAPDLNDLLYRPYPSFRSLGTHC